MDPPERYASEDLQSLESQGGILRDLGFMAQFLHSEGFYAAESALLREIEERFPDHAGPPRGSPGGSPGSSLPLPGPVAGAEAEAQEEQQQQQQQQQQQPEPEPGTVDLQAAAASTGLKPVDSTDSVERCAPWVGAPSAGCRLGRCKI